MKKVFSFTLDEDIIKKLDNFCKEGLITKSKLVNKIINDYIKNNTNENDIDKKSNNKDNQQNNHTL